MEPLLMCLQAPSCPDCSFLQQSLQLPLAVNLSPAILFVSCWRKLLLSCLRLVCGSTLQAQFADALLELRVADDTMVRVYGLGSKP
jgi:hypothetical protein